MSVAEIDLKTVLREQFGMDAFRPGQERIIRTLLAGQDVLAVLPTGAGKSLVYQLAAQLLPGVTVVVSPLLALMQDQVESIEEHDLNVGVINSMLTENQATEELREVQQGEAKLLYVTPERFENEEFFAQIKRMQVSLFVVDEAHTLFEWGHSFRPAYLGLGSAIAQLNPKGKRPAVLALTATASPWVRNEIIERLDLRDPAIVVRGTDRPNLFLDIRRVEQEAHDQGTLRDLFEGEFAQFPEDVTEKIRAAMQGSGIIYTATTKAAKETAKWLNSWGITADYYHGQRKKSDRMRVQDAFMNGESRVIVATNAFGMGIDKPDIRFVIHRDIPASVEAYYQEAGRAGRDGAFAYCALIYRPADLGRAAFQAGTGQLTREEVRQAQAALAEHKEIALRDLPELTGLNRGDVARLVAILSDEKIVKTSRGRVRVLKPDFDPDQVSLDEEEHRMAYERSRLEMMRGYAESSGCLRHYILTYFGEDDAPEHCTMCDNDVVVEEHQRVVVVETEETESPFVEGMHVRHETWGEGEVLRVNGDTITVLFETVGYKTLALALVLEQNLLQIVGAA